MQPLTLHEDRYFSPTPSVRRIARTLYEETRDLPIVSPHGHVEPRILATDEPFPEPTSLIIIPDHYIFRMLYSQGIRLEDLGIPTRDGTPVEEDPRVIWQRFAEHYYLFRGTPTGAWLDHEMHEVFGVDHKLDGDSAMHVYDQINDKLQSPDFRPRALFDDFDVEVLCTTDAATDTLEHHQTIQESDWDGTVLPTFRPDALFDITAPDWPDHLDALRERCDMPIDTYGGFIEALEDRRAFFKSMGAVATDHAVLHPYTERLSEAKAGSIFQKALREEADADDKRRFQAHMLMEMARMSAEDGLVMQLHPGAYRNHNQAIYERFGADKGGDIPVQTEFTENLAPLLNAYGNDPNFTLVLFTLDETTYARELAPLAGHYPCLKLGPAWWFHDSIEGMQRYRRRTTETAGIYNTAGFNDDTRAFCSIPARHDLSRRVDANFLAGLVARHIVNMEEAHDMARALAYDLARETYEVGGGAEASEGASR
jgi:glucuronate isomerase